MSQNACIVEKADFSQEEHMISLPERILRRDDIALVAAGSLSCIRSLYQKARKTGKLRQFFPCIISREEYAAGISGQKLEACLNRVLQVPGAVGIIVYASCMEVITQTDFSQIFRRLDNPGHILVEVLYRGPMVKRYSSPAARLKAILEVIPQSQERVSPLYWELPPPFPDFNGIAAALQHWDIYHFLITAGGCPGGLENFAVPGQKYRMKSSRLTDIQVTMGCEELLEQGIEQDYQSSGYPLACLMGSAVPALTGVDYDRLSRQLKQRQVPNISFSSNGFVSGTEGAAEAMLSLGKELLQTLPKEPGRVTIVGWNPSSAGRMEKIRQGIEHLERRSCRCLIWGEGGMEEVKRASASVLNWVVTAEGLPLARWMEQEFGIPFLTGIPVGIRAMLAWQKQVNCLLGQGDENIRIPEAVTVSGRQPRILITGEPLLSQSIEQSLREDFGLTETVRAVYAPLASQRKFYRETCCGEEPVYFADTEEMFRLAACADLFIGDPVYADYLDQLGQSQSGVIRPRLIPVPDPAVSGTEYLDMDYELFGRKGGDYLAWFLGQDARGDDQAAKKQHSAV